MAKPRRITSTPRRPAATPIVNAAANQIQQYFLQGGVYAQAKHNYNHDFGYPDNITFSMFYNMYKRNGFARAGVQHAVNRTWREYPFLLEREVKPHDATKAETLLQELIDRLSFWQKLREVDERSRIGEYSGLILRYADGKRMDQPVTGKVPGGFDGLVDIIPCYQDQLRAASFDTNELSPTYGHPTMYQFNESAVDPDDRKNRAFQVHPDRVHIWSRDGTIHGDAILEPGFNDLLVMEKIIGAGGEGFWKNAKSSPVLNMDKEMNPASLAAMLGVSVSEIADKLDEVIAGWQKGFDQLLMLQGIDAKTLGITLPQPAEFLAAPMQSFAASINEPLKILIGSQSGERASTEDAKEWDSTIMSRRMNYVQPNIRRLLAKLTKAGILPAVEWVISWTDLTEDSAEEKLSKALKMAQINKELIGSGERAFTADEIREVVGLEPLGEDEPLPEDEVVEEE